MWLDMSNFDFAVPAVERAAQASGQGTAGVSDMLHSVPWTVRGRPVPGRRPVQRGTGVSIVSSITRTCIHNRFCGFAWPFRATVHRIIRSGRYAATPGSGAPGAHDVPPVGAHRGSAR